MEKSKEDVALERTYTSYLERVVNAVYQCRPDAFEQVRRMVDRQYLGNSVQGRLPKRIVTDLMSDVPSLLYLDLQSKAVSYLLIDCLMYAVIAFGKPEYDSDAMKCCALYDHLSLMRYAPAALDHQDELIRLSVFDDAFFELRVKEGQVHVKSVGHRGVEHLGLQDARPFTSQNSGEIGEIMGIIVKRHVRKHWLLNK